MRIWVPCRALLLLVLPWAQLPGRRPGAVAEAAGYIEPAILCLTGEKQEAPFFR